MDDSSLITTSRQVGPLANNTTYYWRVAAGNASGWGEFSSPYTFTTGLATPALSSPANGATNQPTTLTLSWSAVTGATRYRLQVATSPSFTPPLVVDDSSLTTVSRQVGPLANNTTYYWRVAAGNASGWSAFSSPYSFTTGLAAPTLSSPANGATNQPTTLTLSWNAVSGATSYRLQVSTNQNFSPTIFDDSTITTTSRQVGPLAYNTNYYWRVSAKNTGGTGAYSAPWSFTTASGKLVTSPGISFPSDPTNSTDYRLVSFPGTSSLRVGDLLSGNQNTDWRIFRETGSPPPNNLLELGSNSFFSIGEGYWLIKKGTFSFSRSVTMPQLSGDGTYTISVRNGWNIIGNPFDAAIPWSSIQSANGTSNRLWSYEGTSGFVSMSTLEPFRGYYFYSNQTTLKIPYPFPTLKHDSPPAPPIDWQLQLALRTAENEDRQNYVGISPAARETVDELDEPKPPVLSGQAALVFSRPEWNTRVRAFSSDFRPAVGEGQEWEFIVTHQKRGTGSITFSGVRDIPPEYDVVLINEQNTAPFDLRRSAEYSFQIVADTMRFRLVVGTKEYVQRRKAAFVPLEFDVSQNFPNPFNAYTMMKYQLPRPVRVQIDIFSVLGQRVKTLASGLHEAGFYTVVWDGTDDTRNAVASGVYFFRILVDDKPFRLLKAVLMK